MAVEILLGIIAVAIVIGLIVFGQFSLPKVNPWKIKKVSKLFLGDGTLWIIIYNDIDKQTGDEKFYLKQGIKRKELLLPRGAVMYNHGYTMSNSANIGICLDYDSEGNRINLWEHATTIMGERLRTAEKLISFYQEQIDIMFVSMKESLKPGDALIDSMTERQEKFIKASQAWRQFGRHRKDDGTTDSGDQKESDA